MLKTFALPVLLLFLVGGAYWIFSDSPPAHPLQLGTEPAAELLRAGRGVGLQEPPTLDPLTRVAATPPATKDLPFEENSQLDATFSLSVYFPEEKHTLQDVEVYLIRDSQLRKNWKRRYAGPFPAFELQRSEEKTLGPFFTNAKGVVAIPQPQAADLIVAQAEEFAGRLIINNDSREGLLPLYWDPSIEVVVENLDGLPVANQEVSLFRGIFPWIRATTNEQGIAFLHTPRLQANKALAFRFSVGLLGPGLLPKAKPVAINQVPKKVELVLPGTSRVRLLFQDASGQSYLGQAKVRLRFKEDMRHKSFTAQLDQKDQGVLLFPHCKLNTEFKASIDFDGFYPYDDIAIDFRSPSLAGDTLDIPIPAPGISAKISLHVLNPDGNPLANHSLSLSMKSVGTRKKTIGRTTLVTDSAGYSETTLLIPELDTASYPQLEIMVSTRLQAFGPREEAKALIPTPTINRGAEELTLQLEAAPTLAGGYVRNADGTPIKSAIIATGRKSQSYLPSFSSYVAAISDADGHFLLTGKPKKGKDVLFVSHKGRYLRNQPLQIGALDHELAFEETPFSVAGILLLPDFFSGQVTLHFKNAEESIREGIARKGQGYPFHFPLQTDAPGQLSVLAYPVGEVATLPTIVPLAIGNHSNPRLQPWDLREQFALAEVIVQTSGANVSSFQISRANGSSIGPLEEELKFHTADGTRYLVGKAGVTPAIVSGEQLWDTEVQLRPGRQVIQAFPAMRGTLRVPSEPELPEGWVYSLYGEPVNSAPYGDEVSEKLNPGEEANVMFHRQEDWEIRLWVKENTGGRRSISYPVPLKGSSDGDFLLTIPNGGSEFHFDLPLQPNLTFKDWQELFFNQ